MTAPYGNPRTIIAVFVARRTLWGALLWGGIFGLVVASSALGYIAVFSHSTQAAALGANAGLEVLLGPARRLDTVGGFIEWRSVGLVMLLGAIWTILTVTRVFRGEEESGRWELLLAGQTTPLRGALQVFAGITASLTVMYVLLAAMIVAVGRLPDVNIDVPGSLSLALAFMCGIVVFMGISALMSQLASTRRRAAAWTGAIFGATFLLRAAADVNNNLSWLGWLSPLHWIDQLQPLTDPHPEWLALIGSCAAFMILVTVYLASSRDLGTSLIADRDSAPARTGLLHSSFGLSLRLLRGSMIAWIAGIGLFSFVFGTVAPLAVKAFASAGALQQKLSAVVGTSNGLKSYLGFIFLLVTMLMMVVAASQISAAREEEASGFLDNLLVQPVSRTAWLMGRLTVSIATLLLVGVVAGTCAWAGAASQQADISLSSLAAAGLNTIAPATLVLGIGILTLGIVPRLSVLVAYGVIAWSFLVELIGTAINANHWLLDTSILHHIAIVPAVDAKWSTIFIMLGISTACVFAGLWTFARRDLAAE